MFSESRNKIIASDGMLLLFVQGGGGRQIGREGHRVERALAFVFCVFFFFLFLGVWCTQIGIFYFHYYGAERMGSEEINFVTSVLASITLSFHD